MVEPDDPGSRFDVADGGAFMLKLLVVATLGTVSAFVMFVRIYLQISDSGGVTEDVPPFRPAVGGRYDQPSVKTVPATQPAKRHRYETVDRLGRSFSTATSAPPVICAIHRNMPQAARPSSRFHLPSPSFSEPSHRRHDKPGPRLSNDQTRRDQLVELARRRNEQIKRLARLDATHEPNSDIRRDTEFSPDPVPDIAAYLVEHARDRPRGEHLEADRLLRLARRRRGRRETYRTGDQQ